MTCDIDLSKIHSAHNVIDPVFLNTPIASHPSLSVRFARLGVTRRPRAAPNNSGVCSLKLCVCALEIGNPMIVLKVPDPGGDFVDQIVIVRDQQDCSLIALQCDVQRVDGFEVQVVGRFVQHQHVRLQ